MKIAIHHNKNSFSERWIAYCEAHQIPFRIVNCYSNSIIADLKGCDILMWHHNQSNPRDILFAKQLLFSLEQAGITVFPDFRTAWHFDDKVGQKYLLEAIGASLVPSYVFYDKEDAMKWAISTEFPKVFKLRGGAGSANVQLAGTRAAAIALIRQAFGKGFSQYNAWSNLKERWRKFRLGKATLRDVAKGFIRLGYPPQYAKMAGRETGYVYFQDFIPGNDSDIRVIVIDDKAFAIKRMVRQNDFRASGSGTILYDKKNFDPDTIRQSFELATQLGSQCLAIDYVYREKESLVVEISYGYTKEGYYRCEGYWDKELNWHEGTFDSQGWMIESVIKTQTKK